MMNDRSRDIGEFVSMPDDDMLREKKKLLEDVQNEYKLLEADAFKTYKKEVIYLLSLNPALINPATSRGPIRPTEMKTLASEVL